MVGSVIRQHWSAGQPNRTLSRPLELSPWPDKPAASIPQLLLLVKPKPGKALRT